MRLCAQTHLPSHAFVRKQVAPQGVWPKAVGERTPLPTSGIQRRTKVLAGFIPPPRTNPQHLWPSAGQVQRIEVSPHPRLHLVKGCAWMVCLVLHHTGVASKFGWKSPWHDERDGVYARQGIVHHQHLFPGQGLQHVDARRHLGPCTPPLVVHHQILPLHRRRVTPSIHAPTWRVWPSRVVWGTASRGVHPMDHQIGLGLPQGASTKRTPRMPAIEPASTRKAMGNGGGHKGCHVATVFQNVTHHRR